jgi:hypothetical protein
LSVKLRTALHLQEELDGDLAWRIREIAQMTSSVKTSDGFRQSALIRATIPLLYAHWEGYVKSGAEAMLNFVSNQRKLYGELQPCFVAHGLGASLDGLEGGRYNRRVEAVNFLFERLGDRATFPWKGRINTRSNLSAEVFADIAAAVGIDSSRYVSRKAFINERLLKRRNCIAHGEWLEITGATIPGLASEVITLLRWFKTDLENLMTLEGYLRNAGEED